MNWNTTVSAGHQECLGRMGDLEVRLARTKKEIRKAQKLRYKVFYKEMGAIPTAANISLQRDWDPFDRYCDHMIVFDHDRTGFKKTGRSEKPKPVGTYRILTQRQAAKAGGFYSASEYDLEGLLQVNAGTHFMELGRSCVLPAYRNKRTLELLWQGIWNFARANGIDAMIGCASLPGTDIREHTLALSFLHHHARATGNWRARALAPLYNDMNLMPKADIDPRQALRSLPPLIKGYLRAGALVADGAVIDRQFGTTDVLVILPVDNITGKYLNHYGSSKTAKPP